MIEDKAVHVLVADDNEINRLVIKGMLEPEGFLVEAVCNGKEAIQAMESTTYDLVIMDCSMPVLDGFAATKTIRNSDTGSFDPDIPILAITAFSSPEDRLKCLASGMNDCISKPVAAGELFDRIAFLLNDAPRPGLAQVEKLGERGVETGHAETESGTPDTDFSHIIQSLSQILLKDAKAWQRELEAYVDAGSVTDLGALAHKIRGTADVLGNTRLSNLCSRLEAAAKTGNMDQVSRLPERIIAELTGLIEEVQS